MAHGWSKPLDPLDPEHKTVVARTVLKRYKPVERWPTEHIPSRRPAAEAKLAELLAAAMSAPAK